MQAYQVYPLIALVSLISCTSMQRSGDANPQEIKGVNSSFQDDQDIGQILMHVKAYSLEGEEVLSPPGESKSGFTLMGGQRAPWLAAFDEYINVKKVEGYTQQGDTSFWQKTKDYFAQQNADAQRRLWEKAIDDWQSGKKYDIQENAFLISDLEIISETLIKKGFDVQRLTHLSRRAVLIARDGSHALILRNKNGALTFRELAAFNRKEQRIVLTNDSYARLDVGNNADLPIGIRDAILNDCQYFCDLSKVRSIYAASKTEHTVNKLIELLLAEKRMNLNDFVRQLEDLGDDFSDKAGQNLTRTLEAVSSRVNLEDDWFDKADLRSAIAALSDAQRKELVVPAIVSGQAPIVKLLKEGSTIAQVPDDAITRALLISSSKGHRHIIELLQDDTRFPPGAVLSKAAFAGRIDVVELMLKDKRIDGHLAHSLMLAAGAGQKEVVGLILKDTRINSPGVGLALFSAVHHDNGSTVELLLKDSRPTVSHVRRSLKEAALSGYPSNVEALLRDPRIDAASASNALYEAANWNKREVVELLLQHPRGIKVNSEAAKIIQEKWPDLLP